MHVRRTRLYSYAPGLFTYKLRMVNRFNGTKDRQKQTLNNQNINKLLGEELVVSSVIESNNIAKIMK
jgi:hypothetical protein